MPAWVKEACADYRKRLPPQYRFELREHAQSKNTRDKRCTPSDKNRTTDNIATQSVAVENEGESLLAGLGTNDFVVVLDSRGRSLSTRQLADRLERWQLDGRDVVLLVGGPDGLSQAVKARADFIWSLSELTLPHPLVRVILLEQIYRAHSILVNHPYHRE